MLIGGEHSMNSVNDVRKMKTPLCNVPNLEKENRKRLPSFCKKKYQNQIFFENSEEL